MEDSRGASPSSHLLPQPWHRTESPCPFGSYRKLPIPAHTLYPEFLSQLQTGVGESSSSSEGGERVGLGGGGQLVCERSGGVDCHHSPGDLRGGGKHPSDRDSLSQLVRAAREVTEEVPYPRSHSQLFLGWDRATQNWAVLGTLGCRIVGVAGQRTGSAQGLRVGSPHSRLPPPCSA